MVAMFMILLWLKNPSFFMDSKWEDTKFKPLSEKCENLELGMRENVELTV